jgi:hemerythrin-like domain-containing protein
MEEIIRALRLEHANIARLLLALERQMEIFSEAGSPDYDIIDGIIEYFLTYPERYHHPKENLVYARLKLRDPKAAAQVGDLDGEHCELSIRTQEFAAGVRAVLGEAQVPRIALDRWARHFINFQRAHMDKEEDVFIPAALKALTAEDWKELQDQMTTASDPLFGPTVGRRFECLRADILRWEQQDRAQEAG